MEWDVHPDVHPLQVRIVWNIYTTTKKVKFSKIFLLNHSCADYCTTALKTALKSAPTSNLHFWDLAKSWVCAWRGSCSCCRVGTKYGIEPFIIRWSEFKFKFEFFNFSQRRSVPITRSKSRLIWIRISLRNIKSSQKFQGYIDRVRVNNH